MAFTHVVYGRPKIEDKVASLPQYPSQNSRRTSEDTKQPAKRKQSDTKSPIRSLWRLHVVVENLSDVGVYSNTNTSENAATLSLLRDYDLVSLAPRNEVTFQAACLASEADIVTLDYTAGRGGVQLPFRIRPLDVRNVVQRGACFELLYSPALLHVNQRKALVQSARSLMMASAGVRPKPRLIFSSGDRAVAGDVDLGAMALRSPGDLINLLQTVLGLDASVAHDALGLSASLVLERGRIRRLGQLERREMIDVYTEGEFVDCVKAQTEVDEGGNRKGKESSTSIAVSEVVVQERENDRRGDVDDGFITL